MRKQWITRGLAALGLLLAAAAPALAGYVDAEDVDRLNADPSPGPNRSNINNYLFQDEQININPNDGVVKVLRTDQKLLLNDYVTAVVPLRSATPREIRNVMRQVTGLEGGRAEVIQDKETKENAVQVIAPAYMIPYLREAIAALDVPYLKEYWDGSVDIYIKAQHRAAADIDFIAANYAGDEGFSTIDTTNNAMRRFDEEYRGEMYKEAVAKVDIPANQVLLDVKIYEVNNRKDLKLGLDYINWKNGPGRNLFAFADGYYSAEQRAKGFTSVFDPFLEPRLVVVPNEGNDKRLVLDTAAHESYRAVNYLLTSNYVDFLQSRGLARILTSQKVMVVSSNTATITAEDEVLAIVSTEGEGQENAKAKAKAVKSSSRPVVIARDETGYYYDHDNNGVRGGGDESILVDVGEFGLGNVGLEEWDRSLHYQNVGVIGTTLEVTPYVGLESMELEIDLDTGVVNGRASNGLPIIETRTLSTTVRLLDGQPFVVAGLKRINDMDSSAKAPFLGTIPGVGYLFGGETDLKRFSDVVITITPRFYISSQYNIATPPRVDTLDLIVNRELATGLPKGNLGFDQWLFDRQEF